jgi:hypothetical protein
MNAFTRTALTVTKGGLPNVNTLKTNIPEPVLNRQVIYPEMENVFLGKKTIDEMLAYISKYLTEQERQVSE